MRTAFFRQFSFKATTQMNNHKVCSHKEFTEMISELSSDSHLIYALYSPLDKKENSGSW